MKSKALDKMIKGLPWVIGKRRRRKK